MSKRRTDNLRAHLDAARTEAAALRVALERLTGATWAVLAAGTANVTTSEWTAMREACHDARELAAAPARAPGTGMEPGQRCVVGLPSGVEPSHGHLWNAESEHFWKWQPPSDAFRRCPYVEPPAATPGPLPVARLDPVTVEACAHPASLPRPPTFPCPLSPRPPVSGESVTGAGRRWRRANAIVQVVEPRDWVYVDEDPAAVWAWCSFDLYAKTGAEAREVAASIALDGLSVKQVTAAQKGGKRR